MIDLIHPNPRNNNYTKAQLIKFYFGHSGDLSVTILEGVELEDFSRDSLFGEMNHPSFYMGKNLPGLAHCVIGEFGCSSRNEIEKLVYTSIQMGYITFIDNSVDKDHLVFKDAERFDGFLYVHDREELADKINLLKKDNALVKQLRAAQQKLFKELNE